MRYIEMDRSIQLSPPSINGYELQNAINSIYKGCSEYAAPYTEIFEQNICGMVSVGNGVAVSSGPASIHLALMALGVGRGDRVYYPDLAIPANCYPLLYQNAIPEFIDCKSNGWGICELALEKALYRSKMVGKLPKAIVISDLYGQSADYDKLLPICDYYKIPVIEDASQAIGATYHEAFCGSFGKINIMAFDIDHLVTTMGGGMLLTDDERIVDDIRYCNTHANTDHSSPKYDISRYYEHYYALPNICAAIGLSQLKCLSERIQKKKRIYEIYKEALSDLPITMTPLAEHCKPNYWMPALTIHAGSGVMPVHIIRALKESNIEACSTYKPMHLHQHFKYFSFYTSYDDRNNSQQIYERGICLPSGLDLTSLELQNIIRIIRNEFVKRNEG